MTIRYNNSNFTYFIKIAKDNILKSPFTFPGLILLAAILRAGWCLIRESGVTGEAFQVASSLARTGNFADAFGPNMGPTAHLPPIGPAIAGLVYTLLGVNTMGANFVLACYAITVVLTSYILCFRLFDYINSPKEARIIALFLLAILPVYFGVETAENRVWETGLCVVLYITFLISIVKAEENNSTSVISIVPQIILSGIIFFVNPIIGISSYMIFGLLVIRKFNIGNIILMGFISLAVLVSILTPWAIRNYRVMHAFIPLRSNMGLELALANFPEAVDAKNPGLEFFHRFLEIHPGTAEGRKKFLAAGGEVLYSNMLRKQTIGWIMSNPIGYLKLFVSHFSQFILPRPWLFTFGLEYNFEAMIRAGTASIIGLLGTCNAVYILVKKNWQNRYIAISVILPALGYASFQPSLRYVYLIYCIQTFLATDLVVTITKNFRGNQGVLLSDSTI